MHGVEGEDCCKQGTTEGDEGGEWTRRVGLSGRLAISVLLLAVGASDGEVRVQRTATRTPMANSGLLFGEAKDGAAPDSDTPHELAECGEVTVGRQGKEQNPRIAHRTRNLRMNLKSSRATKRNNLDKSVESDPSNIFPCFWIIVIPVSKHNKLERRTEKSDIANTRKSPHLEYAVRIH